MLCFQLYLRPSRPRDERLQWRENEFCLQLQSGKWRIEIHVKKEMCGVPQTKNKSCSYAASLRLWGHLDETTQRIAVESFMGVFAQVSQYFL